MAHYTMAVNGSMAALSIAAVLSLVFLVSGKKAAGAALKVFYFVSAALLAAAIVLRWTEGGYPPLSNTYETLLLFAFMTLCAWFFLAKNALSAVFMCGLTFAALIMTAGSSLINEAPRPLVPALQSNWLTIHVLFSFVSYAAFAVSFVSAVIVLFSKDEKIKAADAVSYKSILTGFPFLTLGIITGAVWAERAWGAWWSWDPKETWALITWFVYAAYLHLRLSKCWGGKKSAWVSAAGFCFVLFTYFGVNYLLGGLHSYK